jgi:DNA-binding NtrC family response regulator
MVAPQKRLLLVDDDEAVLFVLREALYELGNEYEIVTTQSGLEALDQVKKAPCDLLVTDLIMADLDGVQLTQYVRTQSPQTAVIWITAYGCDRMSEEMARLGVGRCADKPVEVDEILQMVREALGIEADPAPDEKRTSVEPF